jgi:hypothetical protein
LVLDLRGGVCELPSTVESIAMLPRFFGPDEGSPGP